MPSPNFHRNSYNSATVHHTNPYVSLGYLCRNLADYLCCIHIFSSKISICCQTFINLKHIQKLEILYEFDVRFHTKVRKSTLSCFTDYITCIGGFSFSSTTDNLLDFYINKTKPHLQTQTYCHLSGLHETSRVAYNLGETKNF